MAAITPAMDSAVAPNGRLIKRYYGTSAQNQTDTLTIPAVEKGGVEKVIYAYAKYSAAPTQAGVTFGIDSGISAAYDATLETDSANVQVNTFMPTVPVPLMPGDAFIVTAPAAGGVITCSIVVVTELGG